MKINPNMGPNFEPQDIQKSPIGETTLLANDQIESFDAQNTTLNAGGSPVNADVATGVPILIGNRPQSFGLNFTPNAPVTADAAPPTTDNSSDNWLDDVGNYIKNFNIVDAGEWLGN